MSRHYQPDTDAVQQLDCRTCHGPVWVASWADARAVECGECARLRRVAHVNADTRMAHGPMSLEELVSR
jgi:hypothetical protein